MKFLIGFTVTFPKFNLLTVRDRIDGERGDLRKLMGL